MGVQCMEYIPLRSKVMALQMHWPFASCCTNKQIKPGAWPAVIQRTDRGTGRQIGGSHSHSHSKPADTPGPDIVER